MEWLVRRGIRTRYIRVCLLGRAARVIRAVPREGKFREQPHQQRTAATSRCDDNSTESPKYHQSRILTADRTQKKKNATTQRNTVTHSPQWKPRTLDKLSQESWTNKRDFADRRILSGVPSETTPLRVCGGPNPQRTMQLRVSISAYRGRWGDRWA